MNTNSIANQNWTINAPAGATYLSDFLTEIPTNCLFNKKQTGCGATELAIPNSIPTIIAMPYVALVKNKTIYRKDDISVLGVYEGIGAQDIIDYAQNHSPLKIAVTYDSLPRTIKALQSIGKTLIKILSCWWMNDTYCSTPIRSVITPLRIYLQKPLNSIRQLIWQLPLLSRSMF